MRTTLRSPSYEIGAPVGAWTPNFSASTPMRNGPGGFFRRLEDAHQFREAADRTVVVHVGFYRHRKNV